MYTLMIVEDEDAIREGLAATTNWEALGFQVAAQAANGREALWKFRRQPVDAVLTDIRMPELDGVGLLKAIRELSPSTEVVFISSYAEFTYAQQAVEYKAFSYIMKFDLFDKLEPTFQSLREHLDAVRLAQRESSENRRFVNNQAVLRALRLGDFSQLELPERHCYQVAAFQPREPFPVEMLTRLSAERGRYVCQRGGNVFVLLCAEEEGRLPAERERLLSAFGGRDFQAAAGYPVRLRQEIPRSYYEALKLLDCMAAGKKFGRRLPVYTEQDFPPSKAITDCSVSELSRLLAEDTLEDFRQRMERYLHGCLLSRSCLLPDCRAHLLAVFGRVAETYGGQVGETCSVLSQRLTECDRMQELVRQAGAAAGEMAEKICRSSQGTVDMEQIIRYVANHFSSSLKLQEVAARFFISPPYLSLLFKKYTGMNFNDYLRRCRLQWAEHLLLTTELKVVEIARSVGYTDQKYFAALFEEQYRETPTTYRRARRPVE